MRQFKYYVDTASEVGDILAPHADGTFWQFANEPIVPGAVYVLGRLELRANFDRVRDIIESGIAHIVFSNPAEGSETLAHQLMVYNIKEYVLDGRVPVISGGAMEDYYPALRYDRFLVDILNYQENIQAQQRTHEIFDKIDKPYKFLFLNGRIRPQRKYLLEKFRVSGLLNSALWTCLDSKPSPTHVMNLWHNGENLMFRDGEIRYLDPKYEFDFYQKNIGLPSDNTFVKYQLFNDQWGEIYLKPEPYIDTYFSLITETVFNHPYSFFTEKIAKPLAIGHPFIVAGNYGYLKDLRNLGFKTFGHLINEDYDQVDNSQSRIERIAQLVEDLSRQDLPSFLTEAQSVCIYNQQHLAELALKFKTELPDRFERFIGHIFFNE